MKYVFQWAIAPLLCLVLTQTAFGSGSLEFNNREVFDQNQSDYKVLVFLSKGCPCSRSHVEHLNGLKEKYKNVALFGVITDIFNKKSQKQINDYYTQAKFDFPVIKDEKQTLIRDFRALKTPHSVLLSKEQDGSYRVIYQGGVTNSKDFSDSSIKFLSENLEALTHGQPLKYDVGKSLGCYIRRI